MKGNYNEFLLLKSPPLEKVNLKYKIGKNNSIEIEKKSIEKLISIPTLKEVKLDYLKDNIISEIKGQNLSV